MKIMTFTFTFDCFPGYTYFNRTKKVLAVLQVVADVNNAAKSALPVMPHNEADTEYDPKNA